MVPRRDDIGATDEQFLAEVRCDPVADRRVLSVDDAQIDALGPAECREDGTDEFDAGLPHDVPDCKHSDHNSLPVPKVTKRAFSGTPPEKTLSGSLVISRSPLRGSP